MTIQSPLNHDAYLSALKARMGDRSAFGTERFTGFFLGPLICVTYHSGHEWNRRITNEKNCAVGVVKKADNGCQINFLHLKGILCPSQFLILVVATFGMSLMMVFEKTGTLDDWFVTFGVSIVLLLILAPIYTLVESSTEKSAEGGKALIATLLDPNDPFAYLNNKR